MNGTPAPIDLENSREIFVLYQISLIRKLEKAKFLDEVCI